MHRVAPLILLLSLVACGGHKAPDSPPAPESGSATASAPSSRKPKPAPKTDTATAEHLLPPAPELDSSIPPEELAAELRLAADSAADEAVLEELADATPSGPGEAEIEGDDTKALAGAVTWDIDVATYNSHNRVRWYLDFFQGTGRERMGDLAHPDAPLRNDDPGRCGRRASRKTWSTSPSSRAGSPIRGQPRPRDRDVAVHEGHRQSCTACGSIPGWTNGAIPSARPMPPLATSRI